MVDKNKLAELKFQIVRIITIYQNSRGGDRELISLTGNRTNLSFKDIQSIWNICKEFLEAGTQLVIEITERATHIFVKSKYELEEMADKIKIVIEKETKFEDLENQFRECNEYYKKYFTNGLMTLFAKRAEYEYYIREPLEVTDVSDET